MSNTVQSNVTRYKGLNARLVWDGTDEVRIPPEMLPPGAKPREDQMQGTARERLVELCGRICYDSLNTGRASGPYHENIKQVNHGALWEHAALTVEFIFANGGDVSGVGKSNRFEACLRNRVGVWSEVRFPADGNACVRLTTNLRSIREWNKNITGPGVLPQRYTADVLQSIAHEIAPAIVEMPEDGIDGACLENLGLVTKPRLVEPETDNEKWVTLYLSGSRGFSHEIVRHGDWTAISQRSTRYVDESESEWVIHPLLVEFLRFQGGVMEFPPTCGERDRMIDAVTLDHDIHETMESAKHDYRSIVSALEPWLLSRDVDKFTARKQARGAARGFLGNALYTEVMFSASVAQWRHILRMRLADAADAEIRAVAALALEELKRSRYGDRFADMETAPAKDGIGVSLVGGGAK